jgi:hypothetical protein
MHSLKQQSAFSAALLDLAAEATPTDALRYLPASRLLDAGSQRTIASSSVPGASKGTRR